MGGNGSRKIHFATVDEASHFIRAIDLNKKVDWTYGLLTETAEYLNKIVDGKTVDDVCSLASREASAYCYAKWRQDFLGLKLEPDEVRDMERHIERYYVLNTIVCNND